MFAFKVEYREKRKFQTAAFVPIGLMEAIWTEVLQMKARFWRFSEKGFPLLALSFQGEKVVIPLPLAMAGRQEFCRSRSRFWFIGFHEFLVSSPLSSSRWEAPQKEDGFAF
jgi:hypothetical protein